ncbi:MAG: hypothetical protein P8046_09630, partial [Anaerolineales bacterium]
LQDAGIQKIASRLELNAGTAVWGEGIRLDAFKLQTREQLQPRKKITIVTIPASQQVFKSVLTIVQPQIVYWVGIDPKLDELSAFLKRLSGIGKFLADKRGGKTELSSLAGAMAHAIETVQLGLQWLNSKGVFQIQIEENGQIEFSFPTDQKHGSMENIEKALRSQLSEAKAYRKFIHTMTPEERKVYIRGLINGYE